MYTLLTRSRNSRRARWLLRTVLETVESDKQGDVKTVAKAKAAQSSISSGAAGRHEIRPVKPLPFPQPEPPPSSEPGTPSIGLPSLN